MKCQYQGCYANGVRRVQAPGRGHQTVFACHAHATILEDLMKTKCAVPDCDKESASRGLCGTHYGRFYRKGWLDGVETITPLLAASLDARYRQNPMAAPRESSAQQPAEPVQQAPEEQIPVLQVPRVRVPPPNDEADELRVQIAKMRAEMDILREQARDADAERATLRSENATLLGELGEERQRVAELRKRNEDLKASIDNLRQAAITPSPGKVGLRDLMDTRPSGHDGKLRDYVISALSMNYERWLRGMTDDQIIEMVRG